jgi:hypothetical protein
MDAEHVTGVVFLVIRENRGQHLITNVNGKVPQPSETGDVLHSGKIGTPSADTIKDGKIVTTLGNTSTKRAANTWPHAAMNSAKRTTRSCRRGIS